MERALKAWPPPHAPLLPKTAPPAPPRRGRAAGARGRRWRRAAACLLAAAFAALCAAHLAGATAALARGLAAPLALAAGLPGRESDLEALLATARLSGDALVLPPLLRDGGGDGGGATAGAARPPRRIPRVVHQTFNASAPAAAAALHAAWRAANPAWELRFYDATAAAALVGRRFPELAGAYAALRSEAARAALFGYLVVLAHGGAYAAADAAPARPLDALVRPGDALLVAWEAEFPSGHAAAGACYARTRQLLHRAFVGAPGHPALAALAARVAAAARAEPASPHPLLDDAERAGAGVFTDALLEYAAAHPPARRDDPWPLRVLPRAAFAAAAPPPCDEGGRARRSAARAPPGGALGRAWGALRRWAGADAAARGADGADGGRPAGWWLRTDGDAVAAHAGRLEAARPEAALYPVSADFEPPFDLLTHLAAHGERQSGWDVGAALTERGAWQPSVAPQRRPSLAEALVGSLGAAGAGGRDRGALVDVGAGYGFVSLAAAARGHRVHAFELGPASAAALEAAAVRNGFEALVRLHRTPLGAPAQRGPACLVPQPGAGGTGAPADVELARGYSAPAAHAVAPGACPRVAARLPGAEALPPGERVGALRVSANGWEGFVLEGFLPLLRAAPPPLVAVEWAPAAMAAAGYADPPAMLRLLASLGYSEASHSGLLCDERWYAATYGVRRRGGPPPEARAALAQPTWCRLEEADWPLLLARASREYPETLLFVHRGAGRAAWARGSGGGAGDEAPPR